MLKIALELPKKNSTYEDIASKLFERFLYISNAMNHIGETNVYLWNDENQFFYDVFHSPHDERHHFKVRSIVNLIPLFAGEILEPNLLEQFPGFKKRFECFINNRPELQENIASLINTGNNSKRLLAIVHPEKLKLILQMMLDKNEFLSKYGVRSVSKLHLENLYTFNVEVQQHQVSYEPAESTSGMFAGNFNWRSSIWFLMNYLIIESVQKFYNYLGDNFKVECSTGSVR